MTTGLPASISPVASSVSVRPKAIWPEPAAVATCLLPEKTWTPLDLRSRKKPFAFSSPQATNRQAACVAVVPKSGLAMPILPFHRGLTRSASPFGRSASDTDLVLTSKIRARAANPYQLPSGSLNAAGTSSACRGLNGCSKPRSLSRMVLRISLFQNRSQRGWTASAINVLVSPTVFVLSTSNLLRSETPACLPRSLSTGSANSRSSAE